MNCWKPQNNENIFCENLSKQSKTDKIVFEGIDNVNNEKYV